MANTMKNLGAMLSDGRTRTVLVFTVILLCVGIVFGFLKLRGPKGPASPGGSAVANAPGGIQSIPGGFGTPESAEYARLQEQQNVSEAKRAMRTGGSAIPTLVSSSSLGSQGFQQNQPKGGPAEPVGCVAPGTNLYSANCQVVATLGPDGTIHSLGSQESPVQPGRLAFGVDTNANNVIGEVGKDGFVRNARGQVVGVAGTDGIVRNVAGKEIGKISANSTGNPVYDPANTVVGALNAQGDAIGANGQGVGKLRPNSDVVNSDGQIVGKAADFVPGQLVYGPNGKPIGRIGPNGEVLNAQGQVIGHVGPNGEVLNAEGQPIGKVASFVPGQLVYGPNGKPIGRVGPNGEVLNAQGQVIGHLNPDGELVNAQGQVIGSTKGGGLKPGSPLYDAYGNAIGEVGANGKFVPVTRPVGAGFTPGQVIYGPNGRPIGRLGPNGEVLNAQGQVIGRLGPNGQVLNAQGQVIAGAALAQQGAAIPGVGGGGGNAALQAMLQKQAAQVNAAETQQLKQQMQSGMASQAGQLMSAWVAPSQQYVTGNAPTKPGETGGKGGGAGEGGSNSAFEVGQGPVVKAGSIMFAVLDTGVNSDEPGPILATITSGGLKGGKLIGALTNQGQRVMIRFNTLSYNDFPTSISINAVAIDPNTARTGLSDYTNNHYLLRYGTLFAASFMQGYAQAISQSGSTIVSNGFNTQKNMPTLSPSGEMVVALGNVGTQYSSVLSGFQNTPPTVYVYSGTGLGILLLSDLKLPTPSAG